jgi:hypothetical protein
MRSSGTAGSSPSFWRAISSLSALRANRAARSPRSGFYEDTSLCQRVVDQCAGNVTPRLSLLLRHDHDIRSDPQRIEHSEEAAPSQPPCYQSLGRDCPFDSRLGLAEQPVNPRTYLVDSLTRTLAI